MISHNYDDGSINLANPIIPAENVSQKGNHHSGKAMRADDYEDIMKTVGK